MNLPLQLYVAIIQFYNVNPDMLIYTAYCIALLIFFFNLIITRQQLKKTQLKIPRSTTQTWNTWTTPLIGIGGLLGVLLAAHNDAQFADLSLLFGGLILVASLFNSIIPEGILSKYVFTPIMSIVILGAVLGELLATLVFLAKTSLSSPLITSTFRSIVILAILLTCLYIFQENIRTILQRLHLINTQPAQNVLPDQG